MRRDIKSENSEHGFLIRMRRPDSGAACSDSYIGDKVKMHAKEPDGEMKGH